MLPTIRSRTHNYTFRLVSAKELQQHLAAVCEREGIPAEPAALALVGSTLSPNEALAADFGRLRFKSGDGAIVNGIAFRSVGRAREAESTSAVSARLFARCRP